MSNVAGIILSNINTTTNTQMTVDRTVAAIPFAGRYRLIDFALSNLINADVSKINVVVNYNYRSLMEHIGSGKDWDLARRGAGIRLLSPYQLSGSTSSKLYSTHLEALADILPIIDDLQEENVVICDSDIVCNVDLTAALAYHEEMNADVTIVSALNPRRGNIRAARVYLRADKEGRVEDITIGREKTEEAPELCLNIFILKTARLRAYLAEAAAHNYHSFTRDILMSHVKDSGIYRYGHEGYYAFVADVEEYYARSIELVINQAAREDLLGNHERPIYTKVHNSAAVRYGKNAHIKNSMIADNCVIDGTVENSILFRGVHVGAGSVIRNSIVMGGVHIGKNVTLNCVVSDKLTYISDGKRLEGCSALPFFIPKKKHI